MALTTRLRSVLSGARERAGGDGTASTDDPSDGDSTASLDTGLFECSRCGTVYVAEEKSTCSSCDEPVEEVSATLSRE